MKQNESVDLLNLGYSFSRIVYDHYVKNWQDERGSAKVTIAKRAVLAYVKNTSIQKNVDPVFSSPDGDDDLQKFAKQWSHQIDKFFNPNETVKLPYSFGDYLVMALDDEYRKPCMIELDRKRRVIVKQINPSKGDIDQNVQSTIKETSEAIQQLVGLAPGGLGDDTVQELMRGRQEIVEAIDSLRNGLALIDNELEQRGMEFIE